MAFRFVFAPCFGDNRVFNSEPCQTKEQAQDQLDVVANYTLFLHECSMMVDHTNLGWIESEIDGRWVEIDDDE